MFCYLFTYKCVYQHTGPGNACLCLHKLTQISASTAPKIGLNERCFFLANTEKQMSNVYVSIDDITSTFYD